MSIFKTTAILFAAFITFITLPSPASAQDEDAVMECDGPPELCDQVRELQEALAHKEQLQEAERVSAEQDLSEEARRVRADEKKKEEERMAKVIATAAIIAVILRMFLNVLPAWKQYFESDKGKAWLKVLTLIVGLVAFIAGNIGFGLPWWQALIIAGGGPGAMTIHSLVKLWPVLTGKEKYSEEESPESKASGPDIKS